MVVSGKNNSASMRAKKKRGKVKHPSYTEIENSNKLTRVEVIDPGGGPLG